MVHWKPRDIRSGRRSEIRHQGRAVIHNVTREQRMRAGEIVVHANHAVVFVRGTLIGCDEVAGSVPIVCTIRGRQQAEKWLHARIDHHRYTSRGRSTRAGAWIVGRRQQSLMRKRIWDGCNSRGCLHFTEALVVDKKEGAVVRQRPADTRPKLVADEGWDGTATQVEIVPGFQRGIAMQFKKRSMEVVAT